MDVEDVVQIAIEPIGPQLESAASVGQLHRDADALAGSPHGSVEHVADTERLADRFHGLVAIPEGEARRTRGDAQAGELRERVENLFRDPVAGPPLIFLRAEIGKGQNGDRCARLTGRCTLRRVVRGRVRCSTG